ncbi:MAG: hypothetical protein WCP93_03040 [Candidatus Berkelbacteria bacterium]
MAKAFREKVFDYVEADIIGTAMAYIVADRRKVWLGIRSSTRTINNEVNFN